MPRFAWCLSVLALALLCVGLVSGTPVRHLLQLAPAATVALLARRGVPWAADAALPICAVWLLLMVAVWLYLLGVARLIGGRFTTVEVALSIVIGAAGLAGLATGLRASRARAGARVAALLGSAAVQLTVVWASLRPPIARI